MNRHLLAAKTAWRYLFAPKSHSAINIISIVSVCGIAVATMAMICVMSVYNGFQDFLGSRVESIIPDVEVRPVKGKVIADADSLAADLMSLGDVEVATPVVDDNMLVYYDHLMVPVRVLGVDPGPYSQVTSIKSVIEPGGSYVVGYDDALADAAEEAAEEAAADADVDAVASMEFDESALDVPADALYASDEDMTEADADAPVQKVLLSTDVITQLWGEQWTEHAGMLTQRPTLMVPRRTATVSTVNPESAFLFSDIEVAGALPADKTSFGGNIAIVSLGVARDMLEYTTEADAVYVKGKPGVSAASLASEISGRIGEGYKVTDRDSQLSVHFNIMRIEKWITFLLLAFILLIASFNIISTISMLIVDKRRSIVVMRNLGASGQLVGEVFCWESFYVCVAGTLAGLSAGLLLCWLQMRFGFIGIPNAGDSLVIDSYPVAVRWSDILWLLVPSSLIALLTATVASRFSRRISATGGF